MKWCPHCKHSYPENISFCKKDGEHLLTEPEFTDDETKLFSSDYPVKTSKMPSQAGNIYLKSHSDKTNRIIACVALAISILTFLLGTNVIRLIYDFVNPRNNTTILEGTIAILNVFLAIIVLIDFHIIRPIKNIDGGAPALRSFNQLLRGWRLLWVSWILLYTCLAVVWLKFLNENQSIFAKHVADGFNMISGFFFYYLFFALDQPSVATKSEPERAKEFHKNKYIALSLGIIALLAPSIFNLLSTAGAQPVTEGIFGEKLVAGYTAIGMVFFFGRLDSHYLRVARVILAPLYLYGIIQLFWGHSTSANGKDVDVEQVTIFALALVLKVVIFLTISKWFRDGRFYRYMVAAEKGLRA